MKLIILDRDGVINRDSTGYIKSPEEWQPIPGSLEAIAKLNQAGFTVIVVTNQSGIGRGYYTLEDLNAIHRKMNTAIKKTGGKIDKIYFCPHSPEGDCDCRKPKPGMIQQAQKDYDFNPADAFFIGDKRADFQTAQNAGCKFILVKTGYGESMLIKHPELKEETLVADNLAEAVENFIL